MGWFYSFTASYLVTLALTCLFLVIVGMTPNIGSAIGCAIATAYFKRPQ